LRSPDGLRSPVSGPRQDSARSAIDSGQSEVAGGAPAESLLAQVSPGAGDRGPGTGDPQKTGDLRTAGDPQRVAAAVLASVARISAFPVEAIQRTQTLN